MSSLFDDFDDDDDEDLFGDDGFSSDNLDYALDDEFDQLRASSDRTDAMDDDLLDDDFDDGGSSSGSGFLSRFSSSQRMILALLLILDIFGMGFAFLALAKLI